MIIICHPCDISFFKYSFMLLFKYVNILPCNSVFAAMRYIRIPIYYYYIIIIIQVKVLSYFKNCLWVVYTLARCW